MCRPTLELCDRMTDHRLRTSVTADGYCASFSCGWRTLRRTRELRDQDADAHQMANALAIAEDATE